MISSKFNLAYCWLLGACNCLFLIQFYYRCLFHWSSGNCCDFHSAGVCPKSWKWSCEVAISTGRHLKARQKRILSRLIYSLLWGRKLSKRENKLWSLVFKTSFFSRRKWYFVKYSSHLCRVESFNCVFGPYEGVLEISNDYL